MISKSIKEILNHPFKTSFIYKGENYYIGKTQDILIIIVSIVLGLGVLLMFDRMSLQNIMKLGSLIGAIFIAFAIGVPREVNGVQPGDYGEDYYIVVMHSTILYWVGLLLIGVSLFQVFF